MAKRGNYTALQRLQPTRGLSQDIQYWNNDARIRRQERQTQENLEYEREQKKKTDDQALFDKWIKPYDDVNTEIQSYDEAAAKALMDARNLYLEPLDILRNRDSHSTEEITKATLKLQNLNKLPEKLQLAMQKYTQEIQAYDQALQEGKAYENSEAEKIKQDAFKSLRIGFDDMGEPVVAFLDRDENTENDFIGVQPMKSIAKGDRLFDWNKKIRMTAVGQGIAEAVGQIDTTKLTSGGYGSEQIKQAKVDAIKANVKKSMYQEGGKLTDAGISFMIEKGFDYQNPDPEELEIVENELTELAVGYTDEISKEDLNVGALNSRARINNKGKGTPKGVSFSEAVEPSQQTWGDNYSLIGNDENGQRYKSVGVSGIVLPAIPDGDGFITDGEVKNYTYTQTDNLIIDVVWEDFKDATYVAEKKSALDKLIEQKIEAENKLSGLSGEKKEKTQEEINDLKKRETKLELELDRLKVDAQNKRKTVIVPKEDEAEIARYFGGIEAMRARVMLEKDEKEGKTNNSDENLSVAEKMRRAAAQNN